MTWDNDPNNALSILVHAPSKTGKSTFAWTAPRPTLVLDAEGGTKFLRGKKTYWDPTTGGPPACDDTWEVCIVKIRAWGDLQLVAQYLASHQHCFTSLVVDSITEIQRVCKTHVRGTDTMRIQDWGTLLTEMDIKIRDFRNLAEDTQSPLQCVVFIAESDLFKDKWRPAMQGKIASSLPYFVDVCGYLYVDYEPDAEGNNTVAVRKLLIKPHDQFEAGERVQGRLPGIVERPNLVEMLNTIYAEES